ncbi:unnamed protein product [Pedinophyceae sp. YPF-701]|nr:unnamed protein product [Pedinophyceae sp. YPF-701]
MHSALAHAARRTPCAARTAPAAARARAAPRLVKAQAFQKFFKLGGTNAKEGGIYGAQTRDQYENMDAEHYFNYIGALADEGTYDRLEAYLADTHPVDVILLLAAENGDDPKIEEVLEAGADVTAKNPDGKTALELAMEAKEKKDEVIAMLKEAEAKAKSA